MKLVAKDNQLFLTYGKLYDVIRMIPYIEYYIIDDIGTGCWHKVSSFYTVEEFRDIKLKELGIND